MSKGYIVQTFAIYVLATFVKLSVSGHPKVNFCHQHGQHIRINVNYCHDICQQNRDVTDEFLRQRLFQVLVQTVQDKDKLHNDIHGNFSKKSIPVKNRTVHYYESSYLKAYDKLNEISVYRLLGITEYAIEEGLEINWNSHYAHIHTLRCALKYKARHLHQIDRIPQTTCKKNLQLTKIPDNRAEFKKWMYSILNDNVKQLCEIGRLLLLVDSTVCEAFVLS